jgi:sensor histidine kinase YesM
MLFLQSYALQWESFSGLMIYATLASLAYVLQISASLREEERRNKEIELRAARAEALQTQTELSALRAKLNPHFLFNTLHTLMALMREDRAQAEAAIERFNSMLRYILRRQTNGENGDGVSSQTTFKDEWQFVQNYLSLEQLRLGDRLTVETKIDSRTFDALLPPLSLQPLIENAIKHRCADTVPLMRLDSLLKYLSLITVAGREKRISNSHERQCNKVVLFFRITFCEIDSSFYLKSQAN